MLKRLKAKIFVENEYDADSEEEVVKFTEKKSSAADIDDLAELMQSQAKVSTYQDAIDAFAQHLTIASQKRVSYNLTEIDRRLDSLARLLEQGSVCAAVCFSPEINAILVATNTIHSGSRADNAWIKQIERVFTLISACHLDVAELIEVLAETIVVHVKHEERHLWVGHKDHSEFSDPNEYVSELLRELFRSGLTTKDWRDRVLVDVVDDNAFSFTPLYKKIIRRASRITRDFLKLRESLHANQQQGGSGASLFFGALKDKKFSLVREEKKDVHAEMRLTFYARKKKYTSASFGISKLCCACCNLSLCAVTAENIHQITTRGQHGQYYGWVMPDFVRNNPVLLSKFLGKEAFRIYETLSQQDQAKFLLAIQEAKLPIKQSKQGKSMIADSSDSDVCFGLSCDSDGELEAVAHDQTLQDVSCLRELKQDYLEQYINLTEVGVTSAKIFAIFKESPEKLEAIGHKNCADLISGYESEDVLEDLSGLFDKNENDFWDFINDKEDAIQSHGYRTTLDAVLQEILSSSGSDEERSINSFKSAYRRAAANLQEDNTWGYEQDSEGEWVYNDGTVESDYQEDRTVTSEDNSDSEESGYNSSCSFRS